MDGMIRLTGSAIKCARNIAAQHILYRIHGTDASPAGGPADDEIAEAVRQALERDIFLQNERVQASVCNGWITVDGSVPTYFQRAVAGIVLRRMAGVRGVTNSILVEPNRENPATAHEAIRSALQLQAVREAEHIIACIQHGDFAVSGLVLSWAEKRALVGSQNVPGVQHGHEYLTAAAYN
jgi:osmotically-inducible protein OsmY